MTKAYNQDLFTGQILVSNHFLRQDMAQTGLKYFFVLNGFELAQLNRGQIHDTPLSHRQSICEVGT